MTDDDQDYFVKWRSASKLVDDGEINDVKNYGGMEKDGNYIIWDEEGSAFAWIESDTAHSLYEKR